MNGYRRPAGPVEPNLTPGDPDSVVFDDPSNSGMGEGEELTFEESHICYKLKQMTEGNLRTRPGGHLLKVPLKRCLGFMDS